MNHLPSDCGHQWVQIVNSCLKVVMLSQSPPITWQQARQQCQALAPGEADLAVMADSQIQAQFSRYVNVAFPGWFNQREHYFEHDLILALGAASIRQRLDFRFSF